MNNTVILITIHGINSDNSGMKNLYDYLFKKGINVVWEPVYTRNIGIGDYISAERREFYYDNVRAKLQVIAYRHQLHRSSHNKSKQRSVVVVCHSFGTMCFLRSLQNGVVQLCIDYVVLLGSIIRPDQRWDGFVQKNYLINKPLNIARPFDHIVYKSKWSGGGLSGTRGFLPVDGSSPVNSFKPGGHISYDPNDFSDIESLILGKMIYTRDYRSFFATLRPIEKVYIFIRRIIRFS